MIVFDWSPRLCFFIVLSLIYLITVMILDELEVYHHTTLSRHRWFFPRVIRFLSPRKTTHANIRTFKKAFISFLCILKVNQKCYKPNNQLNVSTSSETEDKHLPVKLV